MPGIERKIEYGRVPFPECAMERIERGPGLADGRVHQRQRVRRHTASSGKGPHPGEERSDLDAVRGERSTAMENGGIGVGAAAASAGRAPGAAAWP